MKPSNPLRDGLASPPKRDYVACEAMGHSPGGPRTPPNSCICQYLTICLILV